MDEIQQVFEEARKYIRFHYGLELSLIELVRLKRDYVEPAIPLALKSKTDPDMEAATLFLADYYGIPAFDIYWFNKHARMMRDGRMGTYMRGLQEEAHQP
jgi:hypothetical protein